MSAAMNAAMMQIGDALCAIRFKSSQIGSNEDNENYDTSKYRECWVSHARELCTIYTGPDPVECCELL
jgi:hypothetical protein